MKKLLALMLACLTLLPAAAWAEGEQTSRSTGLPTDKPFSAFAVQFDNSREARPQKGLSYADVVYELEIANGGYTRYTAVFNDVYPEAVEAVRSARMMHADVALDWDAFFVHYGGTDAAGISVYDYLDASAIRGRLDGIGGSNLFTRDKQRSAPYNVICRLKELSAKYGGESTRSPLSFSADGPTQLGEKVYAFQITYSTGNKFYPSYYYSDADMCYYRSYAGEAQLDGATGEQITCSNVIVMTAEYSYQGGYSDRPIVTLTGTNQCEYFVDGMHFTGYWTRNSVNESTTYYTDDGAVVSFAPGKTFVQVVKPGVEVTIQE